MTDQELVDLVNGNPVIVTISKINYTEEVTIELKDLVRLIELVQNGTITLNR